MVYEKTWKITCIVPAISQWYQSTAKKKSWFLCQGEWPLLWGILWEKSVSPKRFAENTNETAIFKMSKSNISAPKPFASSKTLSDAVSTGRTPWTGDWRPAPALPLMSYEAQHTVLTSPAQFTLGMEIQNQRNELNPHFLFL